MAAHARLKNEFTEDEKYHNLMRWHNFTSCPKIPRVKGIQTPRAASGINQSPYEIMALFVLRKLILQTRMRSHPVEPEVWFLVGPFVYFHTLCVRTAMALARLHERAGSPEPSLVAYVISTIISWAGSNQHKRQIKRTAVDLHKPNRIEDKQ